MPKTKTKTRSKPKPASAARSAATTYVAWLRGINLGPNNRLSMQVLRQMFVDAGCSEVGTYVQSGNVVFKATPAVVKRVGAAVSRRLHAEHAFSIPIVIRTRDELKTVAEHNPFPTRGVDPRTLHVVFLADEPSPAAVAALDPDRSPPDQFQVIGREIYLRTPNGAAKTKLTNGYFDSKLKTISTGRNWRTVLAMLDLAGK